MRAGLLVLLGLPAAFGGAQSKPANPPLPVWKIQPAPPIIRSKPKAAAKKKAATPSAWAAATEPATTGAIDAEAAPQPDSTAAGSAPLPGVTTEGEGKRAAAAEPAPQPQKPVNDVVTTEVIGEEPRSTPAAAQDTSPAGQYCSNIAGAAADARFLRQKKELQATEQEVAKRVEELDAKIAEYRRWMARRDEFSRKADAVIVTMYSKMKPDAAAQQLAVLDEEIAAAVLLKLDARAASAVMNEMETKRAARLAALLSNASKGPGTAQAASPEKKP